MTVSITTMGHVQGVPGWEGAQCTELGGGLTNRTWKISLGGRHAVLKIDAELRREPLNTRPAEGVIQQFAAAAGLAPRVLYVDEQVYLTDFVEGVVWERACLDRPGNLEKIAVALKKMHALPLTGRTFDATKAAARYAAEIDDRYADEIALCSETVADRRLPQNLCCCHNDLVAENLLSAPGLLFLDWEYACDNDPFFDLATVVEHHELTEAQAIELLDAYFEGDGARRRDQLAAQQSLYLALLWLWTASRRDTDVNELDMIGARVATSCS